MFLLALLEGAVGHAREMWTTEIASLAEGKEQLPWGQEVAGVVVVMEQKRRPGNTIFSMHFSQAEHMQYLCISILEKLKVQSV